MRAQLFTLGSLIAFMALLSALMPGGTQPITAAQAQPVALLALEQIPAGNAEMLAAQSSGTWRNYTNGNGARALAVEGNYVWAGTNGGVVRWDRTGGTYVKYTSADGLADNWVFAIAMDEAGHKWFGTYSGVSEFDGSTWTTYTEADGLADNWVYAIAIDEDGHKWFGTDGGVSEFDGSTWTTYRTADGLASNYVHAIAIDGAGHKWFGTYGGVSEYFVGYLIYLPLVVKNAQ